MQWECHSTLKLPVSETSTAYICRWKLQALTVAASVCHFRCLSIWLSTASISTWFCFATPGGLHATLGHAFLLVDLLYKNLLQNRQQIAPMEWNVRISKARTRTSRQSATLKRSPRRRACMQTRCRQWFDVYQWSTNSQQPAPAALRLRHCTGQCQLDVVHC